jgi:prepilin signal peptidase PulO-like enzyme (type II secretory pathway)
MFFDHATLASVVPGLFDLLAGPIVAAPFFFLWLVSDGRWMGLGDAKLALGIGWMLGLPAAASALIIAFWVGAIAGLILIAVSRSRIVARIFKLASGTLSMKSELPFAPFLIAGTALVAFWPLDLLGLHAFLL